VSTSTLDLTDRDLCAEHDDAQPARSGFVCLRAGCQRAGAWIVRGAGVRCVGDAARLLRRRLLCPKQHTYQVTFDRIGRMHDVAPLQLTFRARPIDVADKVAEAVYTYARPHLRSRDVEVSVDIENHTGSIFCGFHIGGSFTLADLGAARDSQTRKATS
jgi:hypothetical protein